MATTTEKKKKGSNSISNNNNMYVYKFGAIGSLTPEYHLKTVTKRVVSISKVWGLRKSKNNKDIEVGKGNCNVMEGLKTMASAESKLGRVENIAVDGRKSVEKDLERVGNFFEGRKSVSDVESGWFALVGKSDGSVEGGRKSMSSVESEVLGKKMEKNSVREGIHFNRDNQHRNFCTNNKERKISVEKIIGARKSISHVENGFGYRRKVVEVGRKSVGDVEGENLTGEIALQQVKVLVTDMPGFMQVHAYRLARRTYDSLEKFSAKHVAYNMKKEFDKVYGPAWHCIVGSSFGSFVTHSTGCFLYFSMEKLYILLFKTKVQRALE